MALTVISRSFKNLFRNETTDYLLGEVGETIEVTTNISINWSCNYAQYTNPLLYVDSTKTISRTNGSFITDEFAVGDTILITSPAGQEWGTITAITDLSLTYTYLAGTPPADGEFNLQIVGFTTLSGFRFKYNLIENNDATSFLNSIDGTEMAFVADGLASGYHYLGTWASGGVITATWNNTYNTAKCGTCTIEALGVDTFGNFTFEIVHTFEIEPVAMPGDFPNIQGLISPSYFGGTNCLKYVSGYEGKISLYDPNSSHSGIDDVILGNTGWFNEHFNAFLPLNYTLESIVYKDLSNNIIATAQTNGCTVEIIINDSTASYSNLNTLFELQHRFIPNSITPNTDDYFTNFAISKVFNMVGSVALSDTNYAGILQNVAGVFVSETQIKIIATLSYTAAQQAQLANGNYILSVITQNYTMETAASDKMNVLCDANTFVSNPDNASLLTINSVQHFEQPYNETDSPIMGTSDFKGWLVDNVYTFADIQTNSGRLDKITLKYQVNNLSTGDVQPLSMFTLDLTTLPVNADNIRLVTMNTPAGYILPSTDIHNQMKLLMGTTAGVNQQYLLHLASRLRWEDWIKLNYIVSTFYTFYDNSLPQNGINEKWDRYTKNVSWELVQVLEIAVSDISGNQTITQLQSDMQIHDYNEDGNISPKWTATIQTFDGATEKTPNLSSVNNTKIVATFTTPGAVSGNPYGVISIEPYQQGGQNGKYEVNSIDQPLPGQMIYPISTTPGDMIDIGSGTVTLSAWIDFTKIDKTKQYHIIARLGNDCVGSIVTGWQLVGTSDYTFLIQSLGFFDSNVGISIKSFNSGGSAIEKTTDGGFHWNQVFSMPTLSIGADEYCGISIIDNLHAFILVANQLFYTTNAGNTWTLKQNLSSIFIDVTDNVAHIHFTTPLIGVCAVNYGSDYGIYKTLDGGLTWVQKYSGAITDYRRFSFLDANNGVICTHSTNILKTSDAGETWTICAFHPHVQQWCILYLDINTLIICDQDGIKKSTDTGATASLVYGGFQAKSISKLDIHNILLMPWGGLNASRSYDAGATWIDEGLDGVPNQIYDVIYNKIDCGVAGGSLGAGKYFVFGSMISYCEMTSTLMFMLKEDGSYITKEDTGKIIIE